MQTLVQIAHDLILLVHGTSVREPLDQDRFDGIAFSQIKIIAVEKGVAQRRTKESVVERCMVGSDSRGRNSLIVERELRGWDKGLDGSGGTRAREMRTRSTSRRGLTTITSRLSMGRVGSGGRHDERTCRKRMVFAKKVRFVSQGGMLEKQYWKLCWNCDQMYQRQVFQKKRRAGQRKG